MIESEEACGHPTARGNPCSHPTTAASDPDRCWLQSHNEADVGDGESEGRPKKMDSERESAVLRAVGVGLTVKDQAALAGVSVSTLRRHACCIDTLREARIETADPCDFCEDYVEAHAEGALSVLEECRPEFRASASFGYVKEEKQDVSVDSTQAWREYIRSGEE